MTTNWFSRVESFSWPAPFLVPAEPDDTWIFEFQGDNLSQIALYICD